MGGQPIAPRAVVLRSPERMLQTVWPAPRVQPLPDLASFKTSFESTPGGEMSVEANKALIRRYFEDIDRTGDESVLDQYVSADFVDHSPSPGCTPDLEGLKAAFRMFRSGSPGTHRIDDIIAEGDRVVIRVTGQGVHSGELFGIPATQREFTATGITILRIADGKIVERWVEIDMLGALQQLGVIPENQTRV